MPTYKKISELTDAGTIVGDELIEIVQGGASRKVTVSGFAKSTPVTTVTGADLTMTDRDDAPVVLVATAGADRTVTLPAGTAMEAGDYIEVHKTDSATGLTSIARAGSDTIDGVTAVVIDSQYDMARLRWTGAYWTLTEYKDHGSHVDGDWKRYADGTMIIDAFWPSGQLTDGASTFYWDMPVSFVDTNRWIMGASDRSTTSDAISDTRSSAGTDTTVNRARLRGYAASVTLASPHVRATGRWRA